MYKHQIPYSALIDRPPLRWPNDARVALWVEVALEHYQYDKPGMGLQPPRPTTEIPDVRNASWRDYGTRVGLWRLMDVLDKHNLRATACTNSDVCLYYPEVIREAQRRNWEFMGHGINNSRPLSGIEEEEERAIIRTTLDTLASATGRPVKGWVGPGWAETFRTLDLLAEEGVEYVCDWSIDDQPYPIEVSSGRLIGVPECPDIQDVHVFLGAGMAPERFCQNLCDQFDVLYREGERSSRILCVGVHPHITGQPFRAKWLDRAFKYILGHDQVWATTAGEISDWYYQHYYDQALAQVRERTQRLAASGGVRT